MATSSAAPGRPGPGPLLVLCGVSPQLTVTCGLPGRPVIHRVAEVRGHSAEMLAPLAADVLALAGLRPGDLGGVACVRGPGSFTGIRVVLATGVGLWVGANLPLAGLDYLPLLAASASGLGTGVIVVLTHARAGQVYLQTFLADGDLVPMGEPRAMTVDEACAKAADDAAVGPLFLVGDAVSRYRGQLLAAVPLATIPGPATDTPAPQVLIEAASRAAYARAPIEPLYLRPSDAEENLAALAARRGLSLEAATERLLQAARDD